MAVQAVADACTRLRGAQDRGRLSDRTRPGGGRRRHGLHARQDRRRARPNTRTTSTADLGKFLAGVGMLANKVGPSTMGTLLATASDACRQLPWAKRSWRRPSRRYAPGRRAGHPGARQGAARRQTILGCATRRMRRSPQRSPPERRSGSRRSRRSPRRRPGVMPSPPAAARSAGQVGSASAPRARSIPAARRWW